VRKVLVERRLTDISGRLHALREELSVIDEQFVQLADEADDTRLRSLMSETPLADREFRDAQRHADAMSRRRADVVEAIERLEARQDELLDALNDTRR
jgi:predicted  nucleic acid-binding Zn-ribbon protein